MKTFKKIMVILGLAASTSLASAQNSSCYVTKNLLHDGKTQGGYTASIQSVVCNSNSSHTITLRISHNGCSSSACKELSHFSVQANQNSYSSISTARISGNANLGNIDNGWNLGQDPFKGFKIDNTSNIGDGKSGVFTITYTLSGGLQNQQVLAKAGQYYFLASFTISEFTSVMNCNSSGCMSDRDNDGVPDADDDYPTDPDRAFNNYYPNNQFGSLAFEDNWPAKGDFDLNDLVIDYRFNAITNANNEVVEIKATFVNHATGATFLNGFGFQFGNSKINQAHLRCQGFDVRSSIIRLGSNGLESGQSIPTVILFDNIFNRLPHPGQGIGVNTTKGAPYVQADTMQLNISITSGSYTLSDFNLPSFNPFLISNQTRGREIHLPDYAPTDLADSRLFGTIDDASNPALGQYYKSSTNLPWAIHFPEHFNWPYEKEDIVNVYGDFQGWVESGGRNNKNWFNIENARVNKDKIYKK